MTVLLIVAKAPVPGLAKTRLCPPATPWQAAELAAAALLDTLDAAFASHATAVVVASTGEFALAARGSELTAALRDAALVAQRGNSFGERLAHAHADTAAVFPGQPVLQIGMDTPQLLASTYPVAGAAPDGLLDSAMARLDHGTAALLGPALDGGWWALGLADPSFARVLRDVPMSRPDTWAQTRTALSRCGVAVGELARLSDVDTAEDARRVAGLVPGSRFAAAVRAYLAAPEVNDQWVPMAQALR